VAALSIPILCKTVVGSEGNFTHALPSTDQSNSAMLLSDRPSLSGQQLDDLASLPKTNLGCRTRLSVEHSQGLNPSVG
jgi:hypothetical protein